jgi:asparagine synthetase B (glutamine-hydrolysing)
VRKLLIEGVREITRCIRGAFDYNSKDSNVKIAVLFSGGIDSTLIARLLDLTLPKEEQIDLVNLAFREDAPDREAAKISFE